jgi:hypothetical protein
VVQPAKNYNDDVINFYDDQIVPRADMVYRFAFAATLNLDAATRIVRQTFEDIALNVDTLYGKGTSGLNSELLGICWKHFKGASQKPSGTSKSQIVKVLGDLSVEERVILVGIDVLGVTPNEMMKVVGVEGIPFRRFLANARRTLLASTLEM